MGTPDASQSQRIVELETALHACRIERDAALRELDELARYLSHDLRAPLRGVNSYSRSLIDEYGSQLHPMALAYLEYIADSGQLAVSTLEGLIHYIRTPQAALMIEDLDLSALADEIGVRLARRYAAVRRSNGLDAPVSLNVASGLHARADQRLARLLLEALLDNAWKFSSRTPAARVHFASRGENGETILYIEDNGAGFNPAFSGNLFEPFQRLHNAHEFPGVGLGLALARRIVERHHGRIWAQGEVNCGASIFFTFVPS